ncbi:MAG: ABC transporter ATP-binding protein, partial [Alphaproteobacteria bacterium]|nr:ABC transporter ATP-binding protein [Alphaproteobacteria bacterium]
MLIVSACTAATALIMEPIFDKLFAEKQASLIPTVMAIFFAVFALRGIASYFQTSLLTTISLSAIHKMQMQMYETLLRSDIKYLHNEGTAKQTTRFTSDVLRLRQGMEQVVIGGKDIFSVVGLIGAMFYTNWQLSLSAFIFFPLIIFPIQKIGRRLRKVSKQGQIETGQMNTILDDALKNLKQAQAYNRQDFELSRGESTFSRMRQLVFKAARTRALNNPIQDSLSGFIMALTIGWGAFMVFEDKLTQGQFVAFITAASLAYQPVRSLSNLWASVQEGLAAAERIFSVIDYKPAIVSPSNPVELKNVKGDVKFNNVSFSYSSDDLILDQINIHAAAGETVALVGPSGAGKSTILNLVPRFYDTCEGEILLDGHDVKKLALKDLRDQIGLVSQETGLFNDTILNNILYGNPNASRQEVENAAQAASAHD